MTSKDTVRIGGGSGFWGDSADGPVQLVRKGNIDYLILDYLAEITMSILARAKERKPELGYATDFISLVIAPLAREFFEKKIKVVVNAGGCNPEACCIALERALANLGVPLRVAAVLGDDVVPAMDELRREGKVAEMWTGEDLPAQVLTANAYIGAFPIAQALQAGADIVITGRCADSALALGPLIYEFGWRANDWDLLAAGSLAGHVIECGVQGTGGYSTDWRDVADDWSDMGFPIAVCHRDGSFAITKPPGTGGRVNYGIVSEQITYETADPRRYMLPDVVCDLSRVNVVETGPDEVTVSGAIGRPATGTYKVSATIPDGFRSLATLFVRGMDASDKANAMGQAILKRVRRLMAEAGHEDFTDASVEILGAEQGYGAQAAKRKWREVVLKVAVRHKSEKALDIFSREIYPAATAMAPGIGGIFGGRPKVQPVMRLYSFLLDKTKLKLKVLFEGGTQAFQVPVIRGDQADPSIADAAPPVTQATKPGPYNGPVKIVRLVDIAYARSGDKGDVSNIAVIARDPKFFPAIEKQLTAESVGAYMAHLARGRVRRFDWPGLQAYNFLLEEALGGGGVASLRYDPQGKSHAQILLEFPIEIPQDFEVAAR